ncbi:hypothetical protein K3495_g9102 [Podosphaera aphanis]|nr:hypothetical protein K3495_g9102 [Podosphaera aphanis]
MGRKNFKKTARPELQMSRLQRAYRQFPKVEPAAPLPKPVYLSKLDTIESELETSKRLIDSLSSAEICAYPDGSFVGHGRSSWALLLKRGGKNGSKRKRYHAWRGGA